MNQYKITFNDRPPVTVFADGYEHVPCGSLLIFRVLEIKGQKFPTGIASWRKDDWRTIEQIDAEGAALYLTDAPSDDDAPPSEDAN